MKLILLYYQVCEIYQDRLTHMVERFSPNGSLGNITDEELLTIYLFCLKEERKTEQKAMHQFILDYWAGWFPSLPSYQAFNKRLNRLSGVFPLLINFLVERQGIGTDLLPILVGDSCPIKTCSGKRKAKVALGLADKSYCASKDMWYHGVKLHVLGHKMPKRLPLPRYLGITPASASDLGAMRDFLEGVRGAIVVLDKAYCDNELEKNMGRNGSILITPIKDKKGENALSRQRDKAYQDVVGTSVAKVRQPIESFFNWIDEKTGIQDASKVRSTTGLCLHVFGKLAAAMMIMSNF